ncbi:coiled-coil domain-containing protein 107 isoform X4 [Carcharodon carcharias]|uniref:coiled-coil domain-containing protein 107 isoform X4 n=1 Tax=Carcharodon carcharias TaxID=13397 RepID=UPI001B7E5448|nr:coiled-coil domain-containing protein 107 isoform X4 [Carcharodon carcharias]
MSLGQQAALALCLFICVFVLIPRLFPGGVGGGKEAAGRSAGHRPPVPGRGQPLIRHSQSNSPKGPPNLRMRSINQKEMNAEKTQGRNKGFAFQLMPLYAIGISIYAIYKLVQMKFNENEQSSNEKNKEVDKKRKNTDSKLWLGRRKKQMGRKTCWGMQRKKDMSWEVTPVSENIKECVHDFEIKTPVSEDQASTDSGEDLVQDIDPITGNMLASSDFDEIEFGSSISTEDTEEDSEAVANLSETHEPMELRRRNKMNEFGK